MGMAAPVYYTAEMVRALPEDGNRYEAVFGELLVTPAPRVWHQAIVSRLVEALVGGAATGAPSLKKKCQPCPRTLCQLCSRPLRIERSSGLSWPAERLG
jgi:hypothetical protein